MKGLFAWVGYPSITVAYDRHPRFAGKTKWNYAKLFFSHLLHHLPHRAVTIVGFFLALVARGRAHKRIRAENSALFRRFAPLAPV